MATQAKRDYYEILSVSRTATEQEIKSSYRKLAMQYHPDRNPGNHEAEEKFKECAEAYSVLMDAEKRARYDQYGHAGVDMGGFDPSAFTNVNDFFSSVLKDFLGVNIGRQGSRAERGEDIQTKLTLTFEEAAFGVKKQVTFKRYESCTECKGSGSAGKGPVQCSTCRGFGQVHMQRGFLRMSQPCPACQGAGSVISDPCRHCGGEGRSLQTRTKDVTVPEGVQSNLTFTYQREGHFGYNGGRAGDLYVTLQVQPHPFFWRESRDGREGKDLHCYMPISFTQAALGAEVMVPLLEGGEYKLKVPEGTQSEAVFRIRGKGFPALSGQGAKGDMHVHVRIQTPAKLTKRQRELLGELNETFHMENKPVPRSLFEKVKDIFG